MNFDNSLLISSCINKEIPMLYFFDRCGTHRLEKIILEDIQQRLKRDFSPHAHCFKCIYYDPQLNIYGGLFLHEKKLSEILPMSLLKHNDPKVWVGVDLFYEIDNSHISENPEKFQWHYQHFFSTLYGKIYEFSMACFIEEMFMFLNHNGYEDTKVFGEWFIDWVAHMNHDKVLFHLTFNQDDPMAFSHNE